MSYTSEYGASRSITAAQRAAELVCGRMAAADGHTLPNRFWQDDPWKGRFARQVCHANRLLKLYNPESLFRALQHHPRVRSLGPDFVADLVQLEQAALDAATRAAGLAATVELTNPAEPPRRGTNRGRSLRAILD